MTVLLEAEGLTKTYTAARERLLSRPAPTTVLDDVSLTVRQGVTTAVVGESGAGKSTLIRLLLALSSPTSGTVRYRGRVVDARDRRGLGWFRADTGVVLQDPVASLSPRLSVERIVREPLDALRVPGDHRALAAEALASVGLPAWRLRQYPHELSGGQRQRVALARAIVHGPTLLVGDEPMSALDVTVRAQILDVFRALRAERGLGILLVSHDLGLVHHLADEVVVMSDGRVVESGAAVGVLRSPREAYTRRLVGSVPRLPIREEAV